MKKLFLVLCVVIMFFGIVGCPSSDNATPSNNNSSFAAPGAVVSVNGGGPETNGATVPEPTTLVLLGAGLVGLAGIGRKKFFKKD